MGSRLVHVIATTAEGTECALETAGQLASERGTQVIVVVPHVVSFARSADGAPENPAAIAEPYRALVFAAGVPATVRVCFCREPEQVFGRMLAEHSDVVIGGRRRRWWPSREERLARALAGSGHRVTFADVARTP